MARFSSMTRISTCTIGLALLAGTAWAGPQITFGPDDIASLQIDYKGQFQLMYQNTGSGTYGNSNTLDFNFRRDRLALRGAYGEHFSLYVQTEYAQNPVINPMLPPGLKNSNMEFILLDAVARFKYNEALQASVGKFKYSFTRENLDACEAPTTLDRSLFLVSPFIDRNSSRDLGVAVWGNLMDGLFQYRAEAMRGRSTGEGIATPTSNFRYGFRGHVSLFDKESDYGYKGTYLGEKKVLTIGAAVEYEPQVAFSNILAQSGAVNYLGYTFDAFYEQKFAGIGTVTLGGAYVNFDLADAYKGASPDPGTLGFYGQRNGGYFKAAYLLPNLPLQFFGRYENWAFGWLNGVYNQKVNWYGGGARYYFRGQNLNLAMELSRTTFDKKSFDLYYAGKNQDYTTFLTQLQVIF